MSSTRRTRASNDSSPSTRSARPVGHVAGADRVAERLLRCRESADRRARPARCGRARRRASAPRCRRRRWRRPASRAPWLRARRWACPRSRTTARTGRTRGAKAARRRYAQPSVQLSVEAERLDLCVEGVAQAAVADDEQPGVGPPWRARRRRRRSAGRSASAVRAVRPRQWQRRPGRRPSAARAAAHQRAIATELPRVDAVQHRRDASTGRRRSVVSSRPISLDTAINRGEARQHLLVGRVVTEPLAGRVAGPAVHRGQRRHAGRLAPAAAPAGRSCSRGRAPDRCGDPAIRRRSCGHTAGSNE